MVPHFCRASAWMSPIARASALYTTPVRVPWTQTSATPPTLCICSTPFASDPYSQCLHATRPIQTPVGRSSRALQSHWTFSNLLIRPLLPASPPSIKPYLDHHFVGQPLWALCRPYHHQSKIHLLLMHPEQIPEPPRHPCHPHRPRLLKAFRLLSCHCTSKSVPCCKDSGLSRVNEGKLLCGTKVFRELLKKITHTKTNTHTPVKWDANPTIHLALTSYFSLCVCVQLVCACVHAFLGMCLCVSNSYCMVLIGPGIEVAVQLNNHNTVVGVRALCDSGRKKKILKEPGQYLWESKLQWRETSRKTPAV